MRLGERLIRISSGAPSLAERAFLTTYVLIKSFMLIFDHRTSPESLSVEFRHTLYYLKSIRNVIEVFGRAVLSTHFFFNGIQLIIIPLE
jgi:hypothetical protein